MQQQLMQAQQEMAEAEVTGQAGNGLVTVTLAGDGEVKAVTIAPEVVDPDDLETLQDLVVGAVNAAQQALAGLAAEKMGPLAGGLGGLGGGDDPLGLPGF